jgi:poly-gamma-glutamate synthesis protein (capsule biosynthesis protein)
MILAAASLALWFGGDVNLGKNAGAVLAPVTSTLKGAGVVNLEGPMGEGESSEKKLMNDPGAPKALFAAGVRVVGVANNHALDLGPEGVRRTAALATAAGLAVTPALLNGVAITAHDLSHGVPPTLAADLKAARARGDFLVATFHVTGPPTLLPRPELREAVQLALDAGASVVVAHGTHAVGPVERRGDAVIAWGLGNFAFNCDCTDQTDGLVLRVELSQGSAPKAEVIPIDAGLKGAPAHLAKNPRLAFDVLDAIGSSPLKRLGDRASF